MFTMNSITFDSLASVKRLREKGAFSQEQAELIASELRAANDVDVSHLATKEEFSIFKSELRADLAELRSEMKSDKAELIKWMFGGFISIAGLVIAVLGVCVSILLKLH